MKLITLCMALGFSLHGISHAQSVSVQKLDVLLSGKTGTPQATTGTTARPPMPPPPSRSSGNRKTPEQQRTQFLQRLTIDRSNSGILETRLKVKHAKEAAENAPPKPKPVAPKPTTENPDAKPAKPNPSIVLAQYKKDVENLRTNVVLGNWKEVTEYLAALPDNDAKYAHLRILQQLGSSTNVSPRPELSTIGAKSHSQDQYLRPEEILLLSDTAKQKPDDSSINAIAKLMSNLAPLPEAFFDSLKSGTRYFGMKDHEFRSRTAKLLLAASLVDQASAFLPDVKESKEKKDYKALNLLARFHAEAHQAEKGKQHLPEAWNLCLGIVGESTAPLDQRGQALYRALALVPELEGETGKKWLTDTFANTSSEGFEILAAVGTLTAQTREHRSPDFRLKQLELQSAAASALLANKDQDIKPWQEILTLYVRNWNAEASRTYQLDQSRSMRPMQRYDNFGNIYYVREQPRVSSSSIPPISAGDVLKTRPTEAWLEVIDTQVKLENLAAATSLLLKVREDSVAFDLLEELAKHRPEKAKELVRQMIRVWTENNNPNQKNNFRSRYSYYYGYNRVSESIPLTRSKQERNLKKLGTFVTKVKSLKLDDNFENEFADAFIQAHSQAEVWRVEALESVFGPVEKLDPDTIASLIRRMRGNLAGLWPNPKLQAQAKTKRTDRELQAQIFKGYAAATGLCQAALKEHPESWALDLQLASLIYEESNYKATLGSNTEHTANKVNSLSMMAKVADDYIKTLPLEKKSDQSIEPFTTWFYAALGSPDLRALKSHHQAVPAEFAKIKKAMDSLPADSKERHLSLFARTLNSRLANVAPDLKYRYLSSALPITGDHEQIEDAVKVFQYYKDLNTEIELDVHIDGSDKMGPTQPFGLFVNLLHTKEIEREAGGFQKYLVNQNSSGRNYNYGRSTEDYRDKFEKSCRGILEEHFEIVSLTFHSSKVASRTANRQGWTVTPYAYFLLKTKGPEIDSIPPLKIDLDFLDTSGSVILPIASAAIPIDAEKEVGLRPYRDLSVTMILDDREAEEKNELALEIRATGHGLMPPLAKLVKLPIAGFKISSTEDRELQVEELDATTNDGAALSTHEWRLSLVPESKSRLPKEFKFPAVLAKLSEKQDQGLVLQKYDDVDLVTVEASTPLVARASTGSGTIWFLLLVGAIFAGIYYFFFKKEPEEVVPTGPPLPQNITPVTVLTYLENLPQTYRLTKKDEGNLQSEIVEIKESAFAPNRRTPSKGDLKKTAIRWQRAVAKKRLAK